MGRGQKEPLILTVDGTVIKSIASKERLFLLGYLARGFSFSSCCYFVTCLMQGSSTSDRIKPPLSNIPSTQSRIFHHAKRIVQSGIHHEYVLSYNVHLQLFSLFFYFA